MVLNGWTLFRLGFGSSNIGGTSLVGAGLGTSSMSSISDAFSAVGSGLNSQRRPNPVASIGGSSFASFSSQQQASVLAQNRQADRMKQGMLSHICFEKISQYCNQDIVTFSIQ